MVEGKWLNLYDGSILYGAPARGGELKIVTTETIQDGQLLRFAHFGNLQIAADGFSTHCGISIPAEQLQPLIDYLTQIANDDKEA